jgi:hypothetical protein
MDELTREAIPSREIIVQGLLEVNDKEVAIDAGRFSTDSTGHFQYSLRKIKDVRYYNFCIVGDSDYASVTHKMGLSEIKEHSKYLFFTDTKLAALTINIQKINMTPYHDTLYLKWESDNVSYETLYPFSIDNYPISDYSCDLVESLGIRWIGGKISSTVKTKVYSNRTTIIRWELVRNKNRKAFADTIFCARDISHVVNFKY